MEVVGSGIFEFERFRLDQRRGGLFRADKDGAFVPVTIGSRALDVLFVLVERRGDLVSKDEIMAAVWPGIVVAESNLPIQILGLRRVLDRGRSGGSCIQTVAGRGYRFVAAVTEAQRKYADTAEADEAPTASVGRDVLVERRPLTVLAGSIAGVLPSATESDPEELLETMAASTALAPAPSNDTTVSWQIFLAILFSPISAIRRRTKMTPNERYEPV